MDDSLSTDQAAQLNNPFPGISQVSQQQHHCPSTRIVVSAPHSNNHLSQMQSQKADQGAPDTSQDAATSGAGNHQEGTTTNSKNARVMRNRELARVSNAKRKGRIKEMESGLERTRQKVQELQESIRSLEAENSDLRSLLKQ